MPIDPKAYLNKDLFGQLPQEATRGGFGRGVSAAGKNPLVVVLCADLTESTRVDEFAKQHHDRYFSWGIAEQDMAGTAAGLSRVGLIPIITSFGAFSPARNFEQIRNSIALSCCHVIIGGSHAGVSVGEDGATQQALDDVSLMRAVPTMTVLSPADSIEAEKAVKSAINLPGPVYIRFGREKLPVFTTPKTPFKIGQALNITHGREATILATGSLVYPSLQAAKKLSDQYSIGVVNISTIKPLDRAAVIAAAKETGALVVAEEHELFGGLSSAVAETVAESQPVPVEFVAIRDRFGQSGKPEELLKEYGLTTADIIKAVKRVINRKQFD